ncbi:MAG: glycoside hydrolase family 2 protein [Lachnospiraceae bacterium]|nr:glycoside hydrolase family 2 protein [Lachnospiraceae bacterium]
MHAVNRTALCSGWEFTEEWTDAFLNGEGEAEIVRLPHNVGYQPLHYADPGQYSRICGYRKNILIPKEAEGKRLFLTFDGAAHIAQVYINGSLAAEHFCGYTAFRTEITDLVEYGTENRICVRLDTTENGSVPPFGFVIDYLTYGGLYREVWYEERGASYIEDIFITTPKFRRVRAEFAVKGNYDGIRFTVYDGSGNCLSDVSQYQGVCPDPEDDGAEASCQEKIEFSVPGAELWDIDQPNVYTLVAELIVGDEVADTVTDTFGFRHMKWKSDGFYLNGRKLFLRGLNRHQSYPYIGYAAPKSLQYEDARILKEELCCNAVRTSHYPQSQHFIDACDRLGLLVFTEIPGWQHIGDEAWKDQAVENTRDMVLQYRNHPSIFLWGVRINESQDDDALYERTNAIARSLDPTRATSGVRFIEKSHLLEDVYAYNDFSHDGLTPGCRKKSRVTPDMNKPLFISECNGHMFPTKSYDPWAKRQEHALRHARVLHAAMEDGEHAGCFAWCMFDYQTHKDFGSGDKICYHGVLDMFRNPKLAASFYAAQGTKPVLEVGSPMDIGDYSSGKNDEVFAFTNAEEVRLYKNDAYVTTFYPDDDETGMHPPILIDDMIGELLETQEGFDPVKANLIRECLRAEEVYGMTNLPAAEKAKIGYCMLRYHMSFKDGYDLYGKYVGNWGGKATVWRFDAVTGGKVVCSVCKTPGTDLHMECRVSSTDLTEEDTYDMAAVRIRLLDENGNQASYAQVPVTAKITGDAELVGSSVVTAEGGMCGFYIRTKEKGRHTGKAVLTLRAEGIPEQKIEFRVKRQEGNRS